MLKFQKCGDFFLNRGDFRKKVGITLRNVGIFEEKIGGDKWGFLIDRVGIFSRDILATLAGHCKNKNTKITVFNQNSKIGKEHPRKT